MMIDLRGDKLAIQLKPYADELCYQNSWTILAFLGAGATAAVFEVKSDVAKLALKIYSPKFLKGKSGPLVRQRFDLVMNELRSHDCPSLIKIKGGGSVRDTLYMAMERAEGECLGEVLQQVPPGEIRSIIGQVATAAKYLEDRKLCHRDIKVDNIVISSDFKTAVLLDLGVVRWLDNDGTIGTDQDGQLPFIATARYSSPEYMFRLVDPGPDLWRGLTFYQLGGVLHDLIMKEKLFEEVVRRSSENRYLIAHAVATQVPAIKNDGSIAVDLILLAQRALEKDQTRRLVTVDWDDFLSPDLNRQNEVLLGLRSGQRATQVPAANKVAEWAKVLEEALDKRLLQANIHARHPVHITSSTTATINLIWQPPIESLPNGADIKVALSLSQSNNVLEIDGCGELSSNVDKVQLGQRAIVSTPLDGRDAHLNSVVEQSFDGFVSISAELVRKFLGEKL